MNLELADKIAKVVLYEGYMLYPYRASAVKNRQRWNFGAVYPEAFSAVSGGTDACVMQTECLAVGSESSTIDVKVKFLHLLAREVYELIEDGGSRIEDGGSSILDPLSSILDPQSSAFRLVESLEVTGRLFQTWQEAVERESCAGGLRVSDLCDRTERVSFAFAATLESEPILGGDGRQAGVIVRRQEPVEGAFQVSAQRVDKHLFKITTRIVNETRMNVEDLKWRDKALMRTLVSTHTILAARGGEFVSSLDPPDDLRETVNACANIGAYPVLVGEDGERDLMLSSPIILYDYPQIAPESAGDLFDSTEIDEILTLRILTLTEEEKREMRNVDDRARRILERTETMPLEQLMKLHGAVRGLRAVTKNAE
jgi:hydrogenase maturation protease